jgi:hypothetical protein
MPPQDRRPAPPSGPRTGPRRRGVQIPDVFGDVSGAGPRTAADILFGDAPETDEDAIDLTKDPTNTINPARPRTQRAGWRGIQTVGGVRYGTVAIEFREGAAAGGETATYEYYAVPYSVWRSVRRNISTGRTINRTLNNFRYARVR